MLLLINNTMESKGSFPVLGPGIDKVCKWQLGKEQECPHTVVKR